MKRNFKKEYRDLEMSVYASLRNKINNSDIYSKHITDMRVLPVNIFDYTELGIINDRLTFLDEKGYHYSIDNADCSLEDLIDMLEN